MMTKRLTRHDSHGFIFAGTAMVIAFVLGLIVVYFTSNVSLGANMAADLYSTSQSYWTAVSGVEYAIQRAVKGESYTGTFTFYNSNVTLTTSTHDHNNNALTGNRIRLISIGQHGKTKRYLEIIFQLHGKRFWPRLSVIETTHQHHTFKIKQNVTLNDSLYIGGDVDVASGADIGEPPGDPTHIYVPHEKYVNTHGNDHNHHLTWSEYPDDELTLPELSFSECDSLIQIAQSISHTENNRIKGNLVLIDQVLDLSNYQDRTIFVKGSVFLRGVTITGMSPTAPGFIVSTGKIILTRHGTHETQAGDNIILVAKKQVYFKYATQFGVDYSAVAPNDRPLTVNMAYSKTVKVEVFPDATVWGQLVSPGEITIRGALHGVAWGEQELKFSGANAFLEGALFTHWVKSPKNKFTEGTLNLNQAIQYYYFKGIAFRPQYGSLDEF